MAINSNNFYWKTSKILEKYPRKHDFRELIRKYNLSLPQQSEKMTQEHLKDSLMLESWSLVVLVVQFGQSIYTSFKMQLAC